ncbi:histone deacetylase family protein [Advenella mimigardefordensis]|uniref:Histone deacetylase domain-containing protein n=1 Tax=Advenella mimigardefordensis (strain DSM 17166 / LMG 22922 / DPN7) TaxID=1247726 RepID=W0PFA3_ADVMD|nr:histone deacetylase domain-containing protein [Advenella mimigardefordensis DPN7]
METLFITHSSCHRHEMHSWHPESPARLDAINDRLVASGLADFLIHLPAREAQESDLLRVHTNDHVRFLREHSPQEGYFNVDTEETCMNPHTWQAALHAAGAGLEAIDQIMAGHARNAFCAVRPPGHHAEPARASGFCFLNNVAIGVRYAQQQYGLKRIAIVDFDVHHGNGTEAAFANDESVMMCSFFQYPLFPNSGVDHPAANMHNSPVAAYTKADKIRDLVTTHWLPALDAFGPELIFISAGFDAHREDDMGQLDLVEKDYIWLTSQVKAIADKYSGGRIVSMLEGGYALSALGRSVEAHIRTLAGL